jgi:dihydrofolate reductase
VDSCRLRASNKSLKRTPPAFGLRGGLAQPVDGDLFMHGSGEFAYALAKKGLIDEYEVYLNPLVWGKGNVHVLGDRGTIRMELADVTRFDSGVVLLTYLPAT